jgi:CheY-like chemotaxis protein
VPRILIVDDNPADVELMRIGFDMSGVLVSIESAGDGIVAQHLLRQADAAQRLPHLVLLDYNMPRMTGVDVLVALQREGLTARIPVVVLSTAGAPRDQDRCRQLGARAYFVKPHGADGLVELVGRLRTYLESVPG